jgi:putative DNA-invertase from lambdoid prophage Rac
MSKNFLYARVSTTDQHTENQVLEVEKAGFSIKPSRVISMG